ncbi:MAG: tetratricopeptide repeat protein, partial [Vicinamibacterales bacterium]
RTTSGTRLAAGLGAALVVVGVIVYSFMLPRGARALTEQDTIVLADFANSTGEPVFDGTLKVALAVALEQSPFLRVFPEDRTRETLRLMGRSVDTRLTPAVAREIALREQLKALVSGSIARLGSHFVLAVEAINAETGDVMAREQIEAAQREEVLASLGGAVSRLREKLGESLASIQQFDVPLARATTPSLDALHAYSMALDEGRLSLKLEAIPHLRRAVEIDPNFALALAFTAAVYANNGQTALASEYSRRAFDLRDRVSERERFVVGFRYYRDTAQDWEQALELARLWTDTYPREGLAFNSLATAYINLGRSDDAVRALRRAIELDPKFSPAYGNLAAVLMTADRIDDAKAVLNDAAARGLESATTRRIRYLLAYLEGDRALSQQLFAASIGIGQTNVAYGWEARSAAFEGRIKDAHELFRRGLQLATQDGFQEVAAQLTLFDAEVHAMVQQCDIARQETAEALSLGRDNFALERASRIYAVCNQQSEAMALTRELTTRYPAATLTTRVSVPMTHAAAALHRGDTAQAVASLEALRMFDHTPRSEYWIPYLRGQAHLKSGDASAAIDDFTTILDHRGENPNYPLYPLARLGLARAAVLAGEVTLARRAYKQFIEVWKMADPDLDMLIQARQELARLS